MNFATLQGLTIPEGVVTQITDASGTVLWSAMKMAKVTVTHDWMGIDGDTASITITSKEPFSPDPTNPDYKTTSWTVFVYDEPNCTFDVPIGSTVECIVVDNRGGDDSYVELNGVIVQDGDGTYLYAVTGDVSIIVADQYQMGESGHVIITEA